MHIMRFNFNNDSGARLFVHFLYFRSLNDQCIGAPLSG